MGSSRQEINAPKKGMNRNSHPSEIAESEYTFAMNANIYSAQGEGDFILTNEPSNFKCTGFKDGYKVVKHKYDRISNRTYFFMVNEDTGCSEIGFINMNIVLDPSEILLNECNCVLSVVIEDGLENILQEGNCIYNTIISDYCDDLGSCTGCLGFSLENPVTNVSIRYSKSGDELYFSQIGKPPRYIKLDYIDDYFLNVDKCTGEVEKVCLKCDDILIFNKFNFPCVTPKVVQIGGALRAGIYEIALAYSDNSGTELSDYIAFTNYTQIIDYENVIIDQTNLDYQTNQSILVEINDIDFSYEFYKLVVIYRSGNEVKPQYIPYGIFPTSESEIVISQLPFIADTDRLTESTILSQRVSYLTAEGLVDANGYLFQHGLTSQKTLNLQPVVSLMGGFVKWATGASLEKLYKNGVSSAIYKTYHRGENYPLSIQFKLSGGHKTNAFLFIPRPPSQSEVALISTNDKNYKSITEEISDCEEIGRDKFWQYYDTATVDGELIDCYDEESSTDQIIEDKNFQCESDTYVIGSGSLYEDFSGSIVSWINSNKEDIIASSDPALSDIIDALTNDSYYGECDIDLPEACENPILVSSEIIAVDVDGQVMEYDSIPCNEYDPVIPPDNCGECVTNESIDDCGFLVEPQTHDTVIENILRPGSTVWLKTTPSNMSCSTALEASTISLPVVGTHLVDMGQIGGFNTLVTNIPVSLFDSDFEPFLHSNAVFHKITFTTQSKMVVQLSNIVCRSTDSNTNNKVRVTVFTGNCGSLTELSGQGAIISDMLSTNDPDKCFILDSEDITSNAQQLFIAIDSPMLSEYEININITGTNGSAEMLIDGNTYTATFNTNLSTTIDDFYNNSISGFNAQNILHSKVGDIITLRMNEIQYNSLISQTISGDLNISFSDVEEYHTLQPTCGCHALYKKDAILENVIKYENISFVKKYTYRATCTFNVLNITDCGVSPREYGKFSYWESSLKYPCNSELYDSSSLEIEYSDIPDDIRLDFENYYTTGITGNIYNMSPDTNFMDKPIRHYKFPSNITSPFMGSFINNNIDNTNQYNSVIYPIGFLINNDVINTFLDIAVKNELISQEDRDNITGYEIFRGDRRGHKSIIARGLGFDMMQYRDLSTNGGTTYYPNYPLNASEATDSLNSALAIKKVVNSMFTFHSPDTHFNMNTQLPREVMFEGIQSGISNNSFAPFINHPKYTVLGRKAIQVSNTLAGFEVAAEIAQIVAQLLTDGAAGTWVIVSVAAAALGIAAAAVTIPFKYNNYRYEWNTTFENLGTGYNHAYIGLSEGQYFRFDRNLIGENSLRGSEITSYLQPGLKVLTRESSGTKYNVNNYQRENSVFIKIQEAYPLLYGGFSSDTSRQNILGNSTGNLGIYENSTFSPYLTISQYVPSQYGGVNSVQWLSTGYCGKLLEDNSCDIIFGGDIYISRFSLKRKFPFFTETAYNLSSKDPFKYSSYFNINTGIPVDRGYLDYKTKINEFGVGVTLPFVENGFSLWDGLSWVTDNTNNEFYITDKYKFLTHYYGIPYFLVESEINCWNRYAGVEYHEQYYPQVGNTIDWVQEDRVRMSESEQFRYNFIYSSSVQKRFVELLPVTYSKELWDKKDNLINAVIYSHKDSQEGISRSPWLNYSALDLHTFSRQYGQLIDITAIESEQILVRFTDGFEIYNTIDILKERQTSANYELGTGGIFQNRAISFNRTDVGYAGTQHKAIVSTPFGHIWVDSKRGKVFLLSPGGNGLDEISLTNDKWFKEQLPFKIIRKFPNVNIDRAYNGVGISLGYDERGKRFILTKLDYIPIDESIKWDEENGFYIEVGEEIKKIHYSDEEYFKPVHFTVGFSFVTKSWISYYSFYPNYYNNLTDFFQTGVNFADTNEIGLWTHNPMISSYQVFYGKKYPFIIEYPLKSTGTNSFLEDISFYLETKKYYNYYDSANIFGKGFNKSYIYNHFQHSGLLKLVKENSNDMNQWKNFPKYNSDSINILQSETEVGGYWSFNNILNHVKNDKSRIPVFINDEVNVNKEINNIALDYRKMLRDRLRGDYFLIRLIQDDFTQYKMLFKLAKVNRQYYA